MMRHVFVQMTSYSVQVGINPYITLVQYPQCYVPTYLRLLRHTHTLCTFSPRAL